MSAIEQTDMFQNLIYDLTSWGVRWYSCSSFLIKNLLPAWSNFGRMLKQKP